MSLRAKLMLTFISIILVVALVMGISQARLLEAYFRKAVTQQLSVQAGRLENLIKALNVMPSAVRGSGNVASWAAEASASRILITDDKGTVVVDTEGTRSLVGSTITAGALRETLSTGESKPLPFHKRGLITQA